MLKIPQPAGLPSGAGLARKQYGADKMGMGALQDPAGIYFEATQDG